MEIRWIRHDRLSSTNEHLSEILKQENPPEGTVVIADYQEAGKGQGTNSWQSPSGENLLMSLLLFPAFLSASRQFYLSQAVSVAICELMESLAVRSSIKWPNDILSTRGKIAGILIEHGITGKRISYTIAGIGLNVNQEVFPGFPQPASSLRLETGRTTDRQDLAETLVAKIIDWYEKLKEGREQLLEKEYLRRLFRLNEPSLFETEGVLFEGTIRGLGESGELLVEREGAVHPYEHGQIVLKTTARTG